MNYIKHLTGFFEKVSVDYDLNPTHISLYMAIFQLWNQNRFQNPISISRDELMRISKIASTATYHKCMKDLTEREYVIYKPSFNPFKGSILEVCNLDFYTKPIPKKELKKHATKSKNDQVIEQVDEQLTEQALNKHQTSSKHVPYINIINNTNSINLDKQEISKNEKKINFTNSIFDEVQESDLKIEKEKEKKVARKKEKEFFKRFICILESNREDRFKIFKTHFGRNPNLLPRKKLSRNRSTKVFQLFRKQRLVSRWQNQNERLESSGKKLDA